LQLSICGENKSQLELLCWYVPEFSPIFRRFPTRTTSASCVCCLVPA
jgi:hypothetical protein